MFKEMVYKDRLEEAEILYKGRFEGRNICILSLGTHPCAYVSLEDIEPKDYDEDYYEDVRVHGGFTFASTAYWDKEDNNFYLGWDYAHCDDYYYSIYPRNGHKWFREAILTEVEYVVLQLNRKLIEEEKRLTLEKHIKKLVFENLKNIKLKDIYKISETQYINLKKV